MKLNISKIGQNKPEIVVVGCLHGDEIIGKKVINDLRRLTLLRGSLKFVIANELALSKKKRMIQKDLNRSFPGKKKGLYEERLAYYLKKELKSADYVIDIHATNANFDKLVIVTDWEKPTKDFLRMIPSKKVALIKKNVFGGGEMIREVKRGVAIEYGPDKDGKNYKKALRDVLIILANLKMVKSTGRIYRNKDLYVVYDSYKVPPTFKQNKRLKDFQLIKKGSSVGKVGNKNLISENSFYPLFLGRGKYKGNLAIMADKKKIVI